MKMTKWQKQNVKSMNISDLINIKSELEKINRVEYYSNYKLICKDESVIDSLLKSNRFDYISEHSQIIKGFYIQPFTCPQFISVGHKLYKY